MFHVYNKCLAKKHQLYCCFLCSKLFPLSNTTHVQRCLYLHFQSQASLGIMYREVCVLFSTTFSNGSVVISGLVSFDLAWILTGPVTTAMLT